eukprot:CAMPEP_0183710734 /NCGR_PEP_ID=MMETSP0737-20130205/6392_1 /TAXON_ID=385413 /ORGANISM="Thalassiosira miniscula, Strain CCMP1093" /LENGTH=221 /DNA_ID=CAMNT_0025939065 /DNA_START=79 /DNA_END=744 /DNA_ORIENTATION=-
MKTTTFYCFTAAIMSALGNVSADDDKFVTCGSAIKLTHVESGGKYLLQSDERQLQSGSGQQLITAAQNKRSPKGLWQVREGNDEKFCETGVPVKCGQTIRLMHLQTGSNLHTHGIRSPLSNQHEVTGFGQGGEGDSGDDWTVVCGGGGYFSGGDEYWHRDKPIQLKSVATNRYLGSSSTVKFTEQNCGRGCPILNHLEVFGRNSNDSYSHWKVELGVHLSK